MTSISGRLFYIPTNRACETALSSYLLEAGHLAISEETPVTFALIEAVEGPHVSVHKEIISRAADETDLRIIHLTTEAQSIFIPRLVDAAGFIEGEAAKLKMMLLSQDVCYGVGPNKAALLAAALGADTLHRRDSDTVPLLVEERPCYASELEARYVGSRLMDFGTEIENSDEMEPDSLMLFVGSDYAGDLPVDRMELAELSIELMIEHDRLEHPNASRDQNEESVRSYFLERNQESYDRDKVKVDLTGATELGVSCIHQLFFQLPEMPIPNTLGCDYFQKNLLYRLDWPVVYHNRRVGHRYSAERDTRSNEEQFVKYNLMDARYKLLWRIWSRHNRNMEAHVDELLSAPKGGFIDTDWYAHSFETAAETVSREELREIIRDLVRIYRRAFELSNGKLKFNRLVEVLISHREQLIDEVLTGIHDYVLLIRSWSRLISAARECGYSI